MSISGIIQPVSEVEILVAFDRCSIKERSRTSIGNRKGSCNKGEGDAAMGKRVYIQP